MYAVLIDSLSLSMHSVAAHKAGQFSFRVCFYFNFQLCINIHIDLFLYRHLQPTTTAAHKIWTPKPMECLRRRQLQLQRRRTAISIWPPAVASSSHSPRRWRHAASRPSAWGAPIRCMAVARIQILCWMAWIWQCPRAPCK